MNNQALHGGAAFERERELDEQQQRHRALQQEEIAHREREREQVERERQHREQFQPPVPHHSNAGSLPLHQPVAARMPTIHSPGGLLATHSGSAPSIPLGASANPTAAFGGPLQHDGGRAQPHGGPPGGPGPQHQIFAPIQHGPGGPNGALGPANGPASIFGGPLQQEGPRGGPPSDAARGIQHIPFPAGVPGGPPMPASTMPGAGGLPQGQQPILNDALSYLDQVKVQFHEQPDVYNRFLDIMKDFKSQTIDTPGVISRVSELFAGHPNLIQGFNTFLPPGYRIECGLENNPNSIRVTTPSGSTIHSIGGQRTTLGEPNQSGAGFGQPVNGNQRSGGWPQPQQQAQQGAVQHSVESPEVPFSVPSAGASAAFPGPGPNQGAPFDGSSPNQPRAVPVLPQNGGAAGHPPIPRTALTPTPAASQTPINGHSAQQANMEKRGPVEFNHAISYVNKIKNRFQDKPEIYKQFLEILQTYQREQKPIQDVYSQVTTLFHAAPDLLEDFKQFLPESAAQTRGQTNARIEEMGISVATPTPQPGQPARDGPKLPPVGNFAPPASAQKETKKRPRTDKNAAAPSGPSEVQTSATRSTLPTAPTSNKRAKLTHKPTADGPTVEPTLTPIMPEPLNPTPATIANQDDIAFFERVKKHIGNRTAMLEFMKLMNLFILDLITKEVLVHKASHFIGGNADLLNQLKSMVAYSNGEDVVENRPKPPTGRVSLSNCRGYGPSYRLLPKRERLRPCSGRDELCNSVLNDEWASHPTWASEDSGFVAHRKNGYEEGLHRIEEERHDYDFYIEANQKCIQLLEPIAQQMLNLSDADRVNFKIPPGLGGQSTSIYKRVLKKIYGDRGNDVVNDMFAHPFSVLPVVMARLKQKDEEWRFTQREWEKVWQVQTKAMHLKSLDHMGIQVKGNDKRNLSAKHLVDVIKTKHEEQKRTRALRGHAPHFQYKHTFNDHEVLLDLLRFMAIYATQGGQHNALERRRILEFFETFVPQFFDLPEDLVRDKLAEIDQDSAEEEEDEPTPVELTNGRSRRNGKRSDLLRGVLDPGRNGSRPRNQKEDSAASGKSSKETTPDAGSGNDEEMPDAEDTALPEVSNNKWLPLVPRPTIVKGARSGSDPLSIDADGEFKADAPFKRSWYNFYCNQNIFVFFSVFQALYQRLEDVKNSTDSVLDQIRRETAEKPGKMLGMVPEDIKFFEGIEDPQNNTDQFWPRTVQLIEDFITGEIDEARYQDVLRHYYLKKGWKLYTIMDLLKTLCRVGLACNNPDSKGEKTKELVKEYLVSRQNDETSYQTEISARKFAEKCIKDGEMFVICWYPGQKEATVRWLQREETTFSQDEMERKQQWQYYIASYMRIEPTEGVDRSAIQPPCLQRNLPSSAQDGSDDGYVPKPLAVSEGLVLRICLNTYHTVYEPGTSEYMIFDSAPQAQDDRTFNEDKQMFVKEMRDEKFMEKMVLNSPWMKNMNREDVSSINERYQNWVKGGAPAAAADTNGDDHVMAD